MGFNKIVVSGSNVEMYQYEKNLPIRIAKKLRTRSDDLSHVVSSGTNPLQQKNSSGKRKDNAGRATLSFRRIVQVNLIGTALPVLLTLTYSDNFKDIRGAYSDLTAFTKALRYYFGKGFRYISVPEFQKRGAVHFHTLVWGLPSRLFLEERKTRYLARLWGKGFLYFKLTDGNAKISSYLSKYMSKAFVDLNLKNCKAYVASRNILRPFVYSGFSPVWPILEDCGVGITPACQIKEYNTKWLGKGRYSLYKLNP